MDTLAFALQFLNVLEVPICYYDSRSSDAAVCLGEFFSTLLFLECQLLIKWGVFLSRSRAWAALWRLDEWNMWLIQLTSLFSRQGAMLSLFNAAGKENTNKDYRVRM